ncbi:class I SAM-dependent DNA methyltransferase [Vogesella fluminis]|uniref:class I SAM-dependent DNA methyltransferase n=1 Tax=Vogesella fluminis TaxID=1069161 RepID=UPI00363D47BA
MPLSWNEVKDRALAFSKEWANETSEDAEAKSFWDGFFNIFGLSRRRLASFEQPVKKADGKGGFIDLLWKGVLLVEHKSRGKDLDRAATQAFDYFPGLKERDLPRFVLVSDFARFRLYDLDEDKTFDFSLAELYKKVRLFGFMLGMETKSFGKEDPVNIKAAEKLGKLHDLLKASGYEGHELEVLLVRLLFCLFAEDTAIFQRGQFQLYIESETREDGGDLGMHLAQLFQVLNTPENKRQKSLNDLLAAFPYVNGRLFAEPLSLAAFDSQMRETLLDCTALDWSRISPAIFGSLFQSIMDKKARRDLGAHYTSETNILKALKPLFLDELHGEFEKLRNKPNQLMDFHQKLANIHIFDPACGCGNFLVIAYRELRLLELEVLRELHKAQKSRVLDVGELVWLNVDRLHGIELEEFPAQIAQVALWLTDHQMNLLVSEEFGQYFARLPLKTAPHIVQGNALDMDWAGLIAPDVLSYIVGNPPFLGAKMLSEQQRQDVDAVFHDTRNSGLLDYVSCWYRKAVDYCAANVAIRCAFVSTNSITQGEQVGVLWGDLLARGIHIHFAHRTFQWNSEARGKAAVHCVIIGFGLRDAAEHWLYDYETPKSEPAALKVGRINPYLVDAADILLPNRSQPICAVPGIGIGNKPIDGGHYLFSDEEKDAFIAKEAAAAKWFRRWLGADEFINGWQRWCLWLGDCPPAELRKMPEAMKRVQAVKEVRLASKSAPTRKLADTPTHFHVENIPGADYLVIPEVSSERRFYIPIGYVSADTLSSNKLRIMANASHYDFGVTQSLMHMAWVRYTTGRLKSDYQYSVNLVYNNFPGQTPAKNNAPPSNRPHRQCWIPVHGLPTPRWPICTTR